MASGAAKEEVFLKTFGKTWLDVIMGATRAPAEAPWSPLGPFLSPRTSRDDRCRGWCGKV